MTIPLTPSEEGWGYIYILRSKWDISTMSVLKIGFSKYHPEHRAHELASCLSAPEIVAHTPLIPHAKRIETIIHTELVAKRKIQVCGQCGQKHGEWFTISHAESREVVTRWSRWVFRQPYLEGKLSDEWHNFLQAQNFGSIKSEVTLLELWKDVLDSFPHQGTHSTPEEQLATYVNSCYSENLGERLLGPLSEIPLKRDFRSLQKKLRDARSGQALEITDYSRAIDEFISTESKVGTNLGITVQHESDLDPPAGQYDIDALRKKVMEFEAWKKKASEFETWKMQFLEELEVLKNLKTGAVSVSDPEQGITESPLGDATLLPVISLKALKKIDAPARNWIGYNPTHQGFQFLQEAYQRGEWVGNVPQFQLPKAFRKARAKSSNGDNAKTQTSTAQTTRFIRTEESDTWEFSAELNDSFIEQVKQATELAEIPLGRALEKELLRSFKHGDYSADVLSISSDSSGDDMNVDEMDIDEMSIDESVKQPEVSMWIPGLTGKDSANVSSSTSNSDVAGSNGIKLSKAKAKQWLESI